MKKVNPWIWVAAGFFILAAAVLAYKTFGKPRALEDQSAETGGDSSQTSTPIQNTTSMYARYGDRGDKISALQSYLVQRGQTIAVDGIFGPKTQQAVRNVFGTSDVTTNQWQNRRL